VFLCKGQTSSYIITLGFILFAKLTLLALIFVYFKFIKNMQKMIPCIIGLEDTLPELDGQKLIESSKLEVVLNVLKTLNVSPSTQNPDLDLLAPLKKESLGKYTFIGHCFFACISVFFHEYILANTITDMLIS